MSQALTLARPYARAAFSVARDANAFADWSNALGFAARVAADPQATELLDNPKFSRAEVVSVLAPEGASPIFTNLLELLFDNGRLALLPEIAGLYNELRREAEQIVKAKVTSAAELTATELETIKAGLRRRFGRDIEVETAIDASLIGGALIDADGVVIDGTLKGKLGRLQTALSN